ncbi:hypothetical protein OIM90_19210 [Streptomyces sp. AD16]|nr:hypothetical protein OIM90_19210 [Streptomyces sp. AD16]
MRPPDCLRPRSRRRSAAPWTGPSAPRAPGAPHDLPLKSPSTPTGPHPAEPAAATTARAAAKDAAEGVRSSPRPGPRPTDQRHPVAWLTITAPRDAIPTVRSQCSCGRDLFAAGRHRVLALIADHEQHRTTCPFINPAAPSTGRTAA